MCTLRRRFCDAYRAGAHRKSLCKVVLRKTAYPCLKHSPVLRRHRRKYRRRTFAVGQKRFQNVQRPVVIAARQCVGKRVRLVFGIGSDKVFHIVFRDFSAVFKGAKFIDFVHRSCHIAGGVRRKQAYRRVFDRAVSFADFVFDNAGILHFVRAADVDDLAFSVQLKNGARFLGKSSRAIASSENASTENLDGLLRYASSLARPASSSPSVDFTTTSRLSSKTGTVLSVCTTAAISDESSKTVRFISAKSLSRSPFKTPIASSLT